MARKKKKPTKLTDIIKLIESDQVEASVIVILDKDGTISIGYDGIDDWQSAALLQQSADLMNDGPRPGYLLH